MHIPNYLKHENVKEVKTITEEINNRQEKLVRPKAGEWCLPPVPPQ